MGRRKKQQTENVKSEQVNDSQSSTQENPDQSEGFSEDNESDVEESAERNLSEESNNDKDEFNEENSQNDESSENDSASGDEEIIVIGEKKEVDPLLLKAMQINLKPDEAVVIGKVNMQIDSEDTLEVDSVCVIKKSNYEKLKKDRRQVLGNKLFREV